MSTPEQMRPEQMRTAVARYIEEIHRAYVAQALTFPAAVRGRMPLLAPGPLTVAAVGARNLHVLATRDSLGPVRGPEVELAGSVEGLSWTVRFFDPIVLPELSLIDESEGPAFGEVRHALGVSTVVYHFVASPGSGLSAHNAAHVGTGLAGGHSAVARDFETIRSRVRGREDLVDEMAGAASAGLVRAHAMLAAAIAPRHEGLIEQNPRTGGYRLGIVMFELGQAVRVHMDLHAAVGPVLGELRAQTGESSQVGVLDGHEVVYVDRMESAHSLRLFTETGRRV